MDKALGGIEITDVKYDIVTRVEIGFNAAIGSHTDITNIVSFADRLVSRDGKHVDPINIPNQDIPQGVHQNQKMYEMELILDSDNYEAMYGQQVQAGAATSRVIREGQDNDYIEYFRVFIRESDGTETTYTYESEQVWCVGEIHEYSNERGQRHQPTTYRFECLGTKTTTGW